MIELQLGDQERPLWPRGVGGFDRRTSEEKGEGKMVIGISAQRGEPHSCFLCQTITNQSPIPRLNSGTRLVAQHIGEVDVSLRTLDCICDKRSTLRVSLNGVINIFCGRTRLCVSIENKK